MSFEQLSHLFDVLYPYRQDHSSVSALQLEMVYQLLVPYWF